MSSIAMAKKTIRLIRTDKVLLIILVSLRIFGSKDNENI